MSKAGWGVGVSLCIGIAIQFAPVPDAWKWGITIAATLGAILCIGGWLRAHFKSKRAKEPTGLTAELSEIGLGGGEITTPLGETTKGAFCFLTVTIRNSGDPCAVDQFRLKVILSSSSIVFGESQRIPEKFTFDTLSGISQTFYGEDQLGYKTREPIPKGGFVRGRMIYFFPNLHPDQLAGAGTIVRFEMKDAFGRTCSAEKTIKAVRIAGPFLHFPGLRPPSADLQKPEGKHDEQLPRGESPQLKERRQKLRNLLAKKERLAAAKSSPGFDMNAARRRNEKFIAEVRADINRLENEQS